MNPRPTGRIEGKNIVLTRTFRAPIEDVWASITDSERTARWFASWEGTPGAGNTITMTMTFEKGDAKSNALIEVCEAPRHLVVTTKDSYGSWKLEVALAQSGDTTTMTFVHHDIDPKMVGEVGPGWEYYLDNLVAARAGEKLPSFDDYYPSQKAYFQELV